MNYTFQFREINQNWDLLLQGVQTTLELSAMAMILGLLIAITNAALRMTPYRTVHFLVAAYVEVIRNTPLLVQGFLIFFGLPWLGLRLDSDVAALIALTVNVGAYTTEIVRAGLESVSKGQIEAGQALGLTRWQIFLKVELFQAISAVFPAISSQFILLLLASSLMSTIGATELTGAANDIQSRTFRSFEVYIVATVLYFIMAIAFSGLFFIIEKTVFQARNLSRGRS
ncbi:amino acid ABC transporter permease [Castellaniella sp.]|uniref:amino acid ABC transporter permease n=1 Tax=Castellaniella sp. TaxID=1955812 RepID=UPI003569534C